MGQLVQELSFKDNGYSQGIESAKSKLQQMNDAVGVSDKGLMQLNRTYRAGKKELQNLTNQYRSLSDEIRNSDFGHQLEVQIRDAQGRLAGFNDTIGDTSYMISAMASDTYNIDVWSNSFALAAGTIQGVAGVVGLFTDNQKTLNSVLSTATAIQGGYQVAIALVNAAQDTGLAGLIKNRIAQVADSVATRLDTAAKNGNTIATNGLTIAQTALNAVMKMSPWGIIISAIAVAATAFVGITALVDAFKGSNEDANQSEQELADSLGITVEQLKLKNEITQEAKKVEQDFQNASVEGAAKLIGKYFELRAEFTALNGNIQEQEKFVKANQSAFATLGQHINSVSEAEKYLVTNTEQAIDSLKRLAVAAAAKDAITASAKKYLERDKQINSPKNRRYLSASRQIANNKNAKISDETFQSLKSSGINIQGTVFKGPNGYYILSGQKNSKKIAAIVDQGRINSTIGNIRKERQTNSSEFNSEVAYYGKFIKQGMNTTAYGNTSSTKTTTPKSKVSTPKSSSHTTKTESTEAKTVKEYNDRLTTYSKTLIENNKLLEEGLITNKEKLNADNSAKLTLIRYINGLDNITAEQEEVKNKLVEEYKANGKQLDLINHDADVQKALTEAKKNLQDALKKAIKSSDEILHPVQSASKKEGYRTEKKDSSTKLNDALDKYDELKNKRDELLQISTQSFLKGVVDVDAVKQLDELNKEIDKVKGSLKDLQKAASEDDIVNSIGADKVLAPAKEIGDIFKSNADSTTKFAGALSVAGSLLQEVGQQGMAAKIGVMAIAIAEMVASFAQALKTCKTWYEWLAFGASGMAMLVSMIGTVKEFNGGGVVDSNAMVGDKNLIGVNGGEMILNKGQQANLFRLLDNGGAVGGSSISSVRVKGSDLYLALSNYSKIKSKTGKSTGIR